MRFLLAALTLPASAAATEPSIYHYVRSNTDASEPEHVVQFRPGRRTISVYKWAEKCTAAAYVTAEMDEPVREGLIYHAGKVGKNGEQVRFGSLRADPKTGILSLDVTPEPNLRLTDSITAPDRPAHLYDFDLATLNASLQESRPRADFSFGLPLIWPQASPKLFRYLGRVRARHAGPEMHAGYRTRRFDLTLAGPVPSTGTLWIDAAKGFIVEARLGLPNHSEYRDFQLRLERIELGGRRAWERLLKGHYAGCPTGN